MSARLRIERVHQDHGAVRPAHHIERAVGERIQWVAPGSGTTGYALGTGPSTGTPKGEGDTPPPEATRPASVPEGDVADETRLFTEEDVDSAATRDPTSDGRRRAFVAGAARPDPAVKAEYFRRYFADRSLNEEWVTASLGAFTAPGQDALVLPYVAPALDSLPWLQRNRRIFFVGVWLDAMVGAGARPEALAAVDAFLAAHPELPVDLRRKVLQSADELRRTVAVRARFAR